MGSNELIEPITMNPEFYRLEQKYLPIYGSRQTQNSLRKSHDIFIFDTKVVSESSQKDFKMGDRR